MNKLQFKELSYFDVKDGGDGADEEDDVLDHSSPSMSSYALFGLTDTAAPDTVTQRHSSTDEHAVTEEEGRSLKTDKRKKRKKRKRDSALPQTPIHSSSCEDSTTSALDGSILDCHRSDFISKFLSKRRTLLPDVTVPVIEVSNARYLQQFLDDFRRDMGSKQVDALDDVMDESAYLSEAEEYPSVGGDGSLDPISFDRDLPSYEVDELFLTHDASPEDEASSKGDVSGSTCKLQLLNLPYKVTVKEVVKRVEPLHLTTCHALLVVTCLSNYLYVCLL